MMENIVEKGFDIDFQSHARSILSQDFPEALIELADALASFSVPVEELVASGGGVAKGTQRLRNQLYQAGWSKGAFLIEKTINGVKRESITHEIDHVRSFPDNKAIALEIEWNNKDPFFDRDLENFKRLHGEGAISAGIIVTRGMTLQNGLRNLIGQFADRRGIGSFEDLEQFGVYPTRRQRSSVINRLKVDQDISEFRSAWTEQFVSDKFGTATTHWQKLQDRIQRGVGNPCPLLLIGIPAAVITFGEAISEIEALTDDGNDA